MNDDFLTEDGNWNRVMTALRNTIRREKQMLQVILADPEAEDWQIAESYSKATGHMRDLTEMEEVSDVAPTGRET